MSGSCRVVCVGVVTLDALASVPRYPEADERIVGDEVMIAGGGPAANAAVVLARQGISTAFVGRVGRDAAGDHALRLLADEGVDVSGVIQDPQVPTQASCIVVSQDRNTRAISTLAVPPLPPLRGRALDLLAAAEWVHTDHLGFAPTADCLRAMAVGRRPRLAVDAGNPVAGLDLSLLDLYVPTTEALTREGGFAHTSSGVEAAAMQALARGVSAVVATRGAAGSFAWWDEAFSPDRQAGHAHVPAVAGVTIKSTLGAGDVFHGALLSALCRGRDWPMSLREANATAALSCRALDGRSAVPSLDELTRFLASASPCQE